MCLSIGDLNFRDLDSRFNGLLVNELFSVIYFCVLFLWVTDLLCDKERTIVKEEGLVVRDYVREGE